MPPSGVERTERADARLRWPRSSASRWAPISTALVATPRDEVAMRAVYAEVARFTGLPEAMVAQHDGRVPLGVFAKEVRRDRQAADQPLRRLGHRARSLSRVERRARRRPFDGLADGAGRRHARLSRRYARRAHRPALPISNGEVVRQWNWRSGLRGDAYAGAADALREVLAPMRRLQVVVAHGMTDLVTPYMTSRYVIDHLPPSLTDGSRHAQPLSRRPHDVPARGSRARLHADAARLYPVPPL